MNIRWKVLIPQVLFWIFLEGILNGLAVDCLSDNMDDLADYSEFLIQRQACFISQRSQHTFH